MRKIFGNMLIVMAAMMSAACVEDVIDSTANDDQAEERVQMTFRAVSDNETKLTLEDKTRILWEPGDGILVNGNNFNSTLEEPSDYSEFIGKIVPADEYHAVSSNEYAEWNGKDYMFWLSSQKAVRNNLPVFLSAAKCADPELALHFRNLLGYVKFTIPDKSWKISEVEVFASGGETLSGLPAYIDFSDDRPVLLLSEAEYSVPYVYLFSETAMEPGDYYIALYPGTYSHGLKFTFKSEDGKVAIKEIKQKIALESGSIKNIGVLDDLVDQREIEREALIAFYKAAGGDNWLHNDNWCSDKPVGEWWGVTTDNSGIVEGLSFIIEEDWSKNNNLKGTIPPEFVNLKNLSVCHFCDCRDFLKGEFPPELLEMTSLRHLVIDGCGLSGPIPEDIGRLRNLLNLSLQENYLTGSIPSSIADIRNLEFFWINGNGLSGDIPPEIQEMPIWENMWKSAIQQYPDKGGNINPESLNVCFPDFSFKTIDDQIITEEYFRQKEYTVFYNFGMNCPYSEIFTPVLVQLYEKYKDKDIQVFSIVSQDAFPTMDDLTSYMDKYGMSWPTVYFDSETAHSLKFYWHLNAVPTLYVIDRDGRIIYNDTSYDRNGFPKYLAELLGEEYEEELYESKDYSADGQVGAFQQSTLRRGIDVVLMGDGYTDRLIEDGTYIEHLYKAYEALFSIEPYKSFRDLFNVYPVFAVSKNEVYGVEGAETAFSARIGALEGTGDTQVCGDDAKVFEYASKAVSEDRMDEVLVIVLLNINMYAGQCFLYGSPNKGDWGNGPSISYFPAVASDVTLGELLHHEALGHGFAKLADEYYLHDERVDPVFVEETISNIENLGYFKNIDFTDNPAKVRWSHFLSDERYANEDLGIFEGAFNYFAYGIYRPSQTSIMDDNMGEFNAPSREAIYYRIHKLAYGPDWEYDYEKFVEYDAINRKSASESAAPQKRRMNYVEQAFEPTHPPVIVNRSWRDAINRKY